ncbi:MAG: DUF3822 family protein [Lewinella sp.]|nr:DUF3822 family protein [Lewinella sp.]
MSSYELSILSGMDSSSYLLVSDDGQVLSIRAVDHEAGEAWWQVDDRLNQPVGNVQIGYIDHCFTLTPTRLYNSEHRREYLAALSSLPDEVTVMADPIPELDVFLVYGLPQRRLTAFRHAFVGSRQVHILKPLLQAFAQHNRLRGLPAVYAYFWRNELFLVGLEGNLLSFCNAFSFLDAKDALYFVMLAFDQCGWKPNETPLLLCGEIVENGEIYRWLQRYTRRLTFLTPPGDLRWGSLTSQQPPHRFFDLAALQHGPVS